MNIWAICVDGDVRALEVNDGIERRSYLQEGDNKYTAMRVKLNGVESPSPPQLVSPEGVSEPADRAILMGADPNQVAAEYGASLDFAQWDRVGTDFKTNRPLYRDRTGGLGVTEDVSGSYQHFLDLLDARITGSTVGGGAEEVLRAPEDPWAY